MEQPNNDVFRGLGVRVRLVTPENFLKIKETLTRIGVADAERNLTQQCFILHKRGEYAILHLTEMRALDSAKNVDGIDDASLDMRDVIVSLLEEWGLLVPFDEVVRPSTMCGMRVVPYRQRFEWALISPYDIGRSRTG